MDPTIDFLLFQALSVQGLLALIQDIWVGTPKIRSGGGSEIEEAGSLRFRVPIKGWPRLLRGDVPFRGRQAHRSCYHLCRGPPRSPQDLKDLEECISELRPGAFPDGFENSMFTGEYLAPTDLMDRDPRDDAGVSIGGGSVKGVGGSGAGGAVVDVI